MKHLIIGLTTALILVACNSGNSYNGPTQQPEPEMIFGKEKKKLQYYIAFLDSVKSVSNDFIVDTTLFEGGSFFYIDSLGDENKTSDITDLIDQARDAQQGKQLNFTSMNALKAVLKGQTKMESYADFLKEMEATRYLAVLKNVVMAKPKMQGSSSFEGGGIVSLVQVIDLKALKIVKYAVLQAENSNEVNTTNGLSAYQLEQDLWTNYGRKRKEVLTNLFQ